MGADPIAFLRDLQGILKRSANELAALVSADTGKPVEYAYAEVERTVTVLKAISGYKNHRERKGTSIVIGDRWSPLLSVVEKIIPSMLTRELTVIFPGTETLRTSTFLLKTMEEHEDLCNAVVHIDGDLKPVFESLKDRIVTNVLYSGTAPDSLVPLAEKAYVSAECGERYAVLITEDADLDKCCEELVRSVSDKSLQPFRRAGIILAESSIVEYLKNRLLGEFEKLPGYVKNSEESRKDFVDDEVLANFYTGKLLESRGKYFDLVGWNGFDGRIFTPALLLDVPDGLDMRLHGLDVPAVILNKIESIAQAHEKIAASGNSMFASIWSADEYLFEQAKKRLDISSIFYNSFLENPPEIYHNPLVNSNPVGSASAMIKWMSRKSG